jgi:putative membrane protein
MLLVFRINTAYERWWEGRRLWGTLVNNSRSLAVKFVTMLDNTAHYAELQAVLGLLSTFPRALRDHLRDAPSNDLLVPNNAVDTAKLAGQRHKPLTIY